jgi:hypothetical protein
VRGALQRLWRRPAADAPAPAPVRDWDAWWRERGERELRCILMTAWDPVGAGVVAAAWDEYDDYLPAIAGRLRAPAEEEQVGEDLADLLESLARDVIGVPPRPREEYRSLAAGLLAWRTWSFDHDGRPLGGPGDDG